MNEIIIIAAMAENRVIGNNNQLPWNIKEDLQRFKQLTKYHPIIMGRKTYESLPKKPLPRRLNCILTRNENYKQDKAFTFSTLESCIESLKNEKPEKNKIDYSKIFICGGQSIYQQALEIADKIELTIIHQNYSGDTFFPKFEKNWKLENQITNKEYSFCTYTKNL